MADGEGQGEGGVVGEGELSGESIAAAVQETIADSKATPATAPAAEPEAAAAPAEGAPHTPAPAEDFKAKYEAAQRAYSESSREAKRLYAENQKHQQTLLELYKARGQAAPQPGAAPSKFDGAAWTELWNKDPEAARREFIKGLIDGDNPEIQGIVQKLIDEKVAPIIGPIQQREQETRLASMRNECWKNHPEFAPKSEGHGIVAQQLEAHPELAAVFNEMAEKLPNVNMSEMIGRYFYYPILMAQLKAKGPLEAAARAKAGGTARPGSPHAAAPKGENLKTGVRNIADEFGVNADAADALTAEFAEKLRLNEK